MNQAAPIILLTDTITLVQIIQTSMLMQYPIALNHRINKIPFV